MSEWHWKDKGGSSGGLLYEPGNWGDILKCEWLLRIVDFIKSSGGNESEYLDLFAGLPVYPLSDSCMRRIECLSEAFFLKKALADFLKRDKWPSAARLVLDNSEMAVSIYDQDNLRCSEWAPLANNLNLSDGWDFLPLKTNHDYALVLIDPYDFLAEWRTNLDKLVATAGNCPVLLYIYNRSGRNKERLRDYRLFINHLRDTGVRSFYGRVAADSFIPDCWHELLFFPQELSALKSFNALIDDLRKVSWLLQQQVDGLGIFGEY